LKGATEVAEGWRKFLGHWHGYRIKAEEYSQLVDDKPQRRRKTGRETAAMGSSEQNRAARGPLTSDGGEGKVSE
jgi:hypothetical protein